MVNPPLPVGSICCGLFSRGDGTFHWAVIIPYDTDNAYKLHATNEQGGWVFERRDENLRVSQNLCVLVKIGTSNEANTLNVVTDLVKPISMSVPAADAGIEKTFTCRVWFKEAVRTLAANGVIQCPDVTALEKELIAFGQKNDPETLAGNPYTVHVARCST